MKNNKKYPFDRNDIHDDNITGHLEHIHREFADGFEFIKKFPKSVSIFGSSHATSEMKHYQYAEKLSGRIVSELGYAIITGGGPGIMEAANKGAYDAGGPSVGLNVSLPHEWSTNAFCTHALKFSYFFSRKTMLTFAAESFVFFPGGFGTMDELFGILTLIQTEKIPRVPIILFDSEYWNDFYKFIYDDLLRRFETISKEEFKLFEITDSMDRAIEIIKHAPLSEWWRNIN